MNIYKQRLLNVARALRESPAPESFNMRRELWDCKTPACAWGHYLLRSDLQSEFRLHSPDIGRALHVPTGQVVCYAAPHVQNHFGLDQQEHRNIFSAWVGCGDPRTPEEAAEYIEHFCANKWPEEESLPPQVLAALNTQRGIP